MKVISTDKAPGAIGPYSQGYEAGGLVITSGQLPVDPATGAMPEGIAAQAEESALIPYAEDDEGAHTFTLPVEALDMGVNCAAFSKKKGDVV